MAEPGSKDALCSQCGQSVEQRKMIPVLGADGPSGPPAHVCVDCARAQIPEDYEDPATAGEEPAAGSASHSSG